MGARTEHVSRAAQHICLLTLDIDLQQVGPRNVLAGYDPVQCLDIGGCVGLIAQIDLSKADQWLDRGIESQIVAHTIDTGWIELEAPNWLIGKASENHGVVGVVAAYIETSKAWLG